MSPQEYDKFKDSGVEAPRDRDRIVYVRLSSYHYDRIMREVAYRRKKGINATFSKILRYIIETGISAIP